jgi:hypothetical protein
MGDIVKVYELNWGSASIGTPPLPDGLWINHERIAIHWPTFCRNYLHSSEYSLNREHLTQFYISYEDNDIVEGMHFNAYRLNDLFFSERPYLGVKRAKIFTTIKP